MVASDGDLDVVSVVSPLGYFLFSTHNLLCGCYDEPTSYYDAGAFLV